MIMKNNIKCVDEILENFNTFYWKSDMASSISLINDLRLSNNIHETAHSRLLYKILCFNNKGSYPFLELFFDELKIFDNDTFDLSKANIEIEYEHIDVLIHDEHIYVIIENKVNHARDQKRQLDTYVEKCLKMHAEHIFILYLVRNDSDDGPSKESLSDELLKKIESNDGKFKKIAYSSCIRNWLYRCKNVKIDNELLHSALIQYIDFLEKMFNISNQMTENDIKNFEQEVLKMSQDNNDPMTIVSKLTSVKDKIRDLNETIAKYENNLCEKYLEDFKNKTNMDDAIINKDKQIEFHITVCNCQILFIYDFLNLNDYESVWFGAKTPFIKSDPIKVKEVLDKMHNVPEGFELDKYDNYSSCKENGFKNFYLDKYWFCKYCKSNQSAIEEIIKYKKFIEA